MSEPRAEYVVAEDVEPVDMRPVTWECYMSVVRMYMDAGTEAILCGNVLRALRDCEAMPVLGMPEMVAVRVPKALWALIRGEEGE